MENHSSPIMETLYSIEDAAKKLGGVSPGTVAVWLSQGKLQRTKVGGRTMIAESELQKILNVGGISRAPAPRKKNKDDTESAVS